MELRKITKIYNYGKANEVCALNDINISFEKGKFYAIMGKSGSGKSTLINILGLMDEPTMGMYTLLGKNITELSDTEKAKIRNLYIGFVFQSYYLENKLTALENIILPSLINQNLSNLDRKSRAQNLLNSLGLSNRVHHYPSELSGGECQRVAIARALMNEPDIIIADEPTGNLDTKNEQEIFEMLKNISNSGKIVIVVSHNPSIKEYADKIYYLKDGVLNDKEY